MGFICAGCPTGGVGLPHRLLCHAMPRLCHVRCCSGRRVPSNSCSASGSSNGVSTSSARWGWGHCSRTCYGGGAQPSAAAPRGGGRVGVPGALTEVRVWKMRSSSSGPEGVRMCCQLYACRGGGDNGVVPCSPPTPPGPPYGRVWGLWVGGLRAHRVWGWGGSVPVGSHPPRTYQEVEGVFRLLEEVHILCLGGEIWGGGGGADRGGGTAAAPGPPSHPQRCPPPTPPPFFFFFFFFFGVLVLPALPRSRPTSSSISPSTWLRTNCGDRGGNGGQWGVGWGALVWGGGQKGGGGMGVRTTSRSGSDMTSPLGPIQMF